MNLFDLLGLAGQHPSARNWLTDLLWNPLTFLLIILMAGWAVFHAVNSTPF
jgi:hypothetical protein